MKTLPAVLMAMLLCFCPERAGAEPEAAQIGATMKRAADWQLAHPNRTPLSDWVIAPLYDGLIELSRTTGDARYLAAVVRMGTQSAWLPGGRVYFADDHAVGHAWLEIYGMNPAHRERLEPFRRRFEQILARPVTARLSLGPGGEKVPGVSATDRWTWCDALFMAPPTLARLARATGETRFLDFLDAEYRETYAALFDPEENLFYRDGHYLGLRSAHGRKVFWSRGNGWVLAGLPMVLEALPEDRASRAFYTELFRKMAPAVLAAQQPDGFWYPSLLDPEEVPLGETSGSAFFVYGLAWGVNHGLLERERYWPAVVRGWQALSTHVGAEGQVGYVQPIGAAPGEVKPGSTQLYGTGGVLLAGAEMLRGLGAAAPVEPAALLAEAEKLLAAEQGPRAYARFFPERKDDLAWENDKVVYRIYGPALRAGHEANGIDAWAKSVARPVLGSWYADDLAGRRSYHEDHGEGFDGYEVGDTPGCGGTGLWQGDHFVNAEVYEQARLLFTTAEVAEFEADYTYPKVEGVEYRERRTIRLRLGEHLNEVTSRFTRGNKPVAGLEVVVVLAAQTPGAEFTLQPERGLMAVWDTLDKSRKPFGIGALVPAGARMVRLPHTTGLPKAEMAVAVLRTDERGEIRYRAGFGWPGDGEVLSAEAWRRYLEAGGVR